VRPGNSQSFDVRGDTVLGRDPGGGIALPLEGVSRLHARLVADGKGYWLEDLKSTNGTFLNGEPLREREKLRHLDVISLGRQVDVLFLLRENEATAGARRALGVVRCALLRDAGDAVPYEVPTGEVRVGRSPACNLQIEASSVSKFHARFERGVDRVVVNDEGSSNGTFVNGSRITEPTELHDGDVVSLGGSEGLRVVIEMGEVVAVAAATTGSAPRPAEAAQWNADWRTRLEWNTSELAAIRDLRGDEPATVLRRPNAEPATILRKPGAGSEGPTVSKRPPAPPGPPAVPAPPAPAPAAAAALAAAKPAAAPAPAPAPAAPVTREAPRPRPPRVVAVRLRAAGLDLTLRSAGSWEIGRSREAAIRIDHPTISRRHARLTLDAAFACAIEDLGAANGTFVDEVRLATGAPRTLAAGERLRLGDLELTLERVPE
jgi:pSer/pThr/pTyr-binding forkhead associated (FHA) protein